MTKEERERAEQSGERVLFKSPSNDVYVAQMPNGHIAITDGFSTDYVNIRGRGDWVRDSDQLQISQEIREFLSSVDSVESAVKRQENTAFIVLTIDNTDNAAFVDVGRDDEVARIIDEAANTITAKAGLRDVEFNLRDTNGNRVGKVEYTSSAPVGELEPGGVRLVVNLGASEFSPTSPKDVENLFREVANKARDGNHQFELHNPDEGVECSFQFQELPSLVKDGVIDMAEALNAGRVYWADAGYSGIADGEYRFVVTTPEFTPGYHQGEGDAWLVNAKGEVAAGYEEPQVVREITLSALKHQEEEELRAVVEGRVTFDDYERRLSGDEPELG